MSSIVTALFSAGCIFSGGLLGLWLRKLLPPSHLDEASKDTIKIGTGILATLSALVLGLLISSAKSSFDATSSGLAQGSAKVILLDRTLSEYGIEALPARALLKSAVQHTADRVWAKKSNEFTGSKGFELSDGMEKLQGTLRQLNPQNKAQEHILSSALQLTSEIAQTRWFLIEQESPLPPTLLVVLVLWLSLLHVSMGLFAPFNGTVLSVLVISSLSVSSALFLVLEMNRPLDGIVKVSDAPVRKALEHLLQ